MRNGRGAKGPAVAAIGLPRGPISFPAYQLLVLEERLRERQEAGDLKAVVDHLVAETTAGL
jgi:hypothetical protein